MVMASKKHPNVTLVIEDSGLLILANEAGKWTGRLKELLASIAAPMVNDS